MLDMFAIVTVDPFLGQKPHISSSVFLDMVYFLIIQTIFQSYVLINLPFAYSSINEKEYKQQKPFHFYKMIHIFTNIQKILCKNMKNLIKTQYYECIHIQLIIKINPHVSRLRKLSQIQKNNHPITIQKHIYHFILYTSVPPFTISSCEIVFFV